MSNLVTITDPSTGRTYRVHPFVAEQGEWFDQDDAAFRAQLPGAATLERDLARAIKAARLATPSAAPHTQHPTPITAGVLKKAQANVS